MMDKFKIFTGTAKLDDYSWEADTVGVAVNQVKNGRLFGREVLIFLDQETGEVIEQYKGKRFYQICNTVSFPCTREIEFSKFLNFEVDKPEYNYYATEKFYFYRDPSDRVRFHWLKNAPTLPWMFEDPKKRMLFSSRGFALPSVEVMFQYLANSYVENLIKERYPDILIPLESDPEFCENSFFRY